MSIYKNDIFNGSIYLPLKERQKKNIKKPKVIVIAGPTALGKTDISLEIASIVPSEIVSADSMQVYRNMNIGTAKASKDEMGQVKHHMIDILDISMSFNVSDFYREANRAIREILLRKNIPIVVGGSGFYINALLYGPPLGPPSNIEIRKNLEKKLI